MSNAITADLSIEYLPTQGCKTGVWREDRYSDDPRDFSLFEVMPALIVSYQRAFQTISSTIDIWLEENQSRSEVVTLAREGNPLLISDLGWTFEQALRARMQLLTFEDDWNAPGMEDYDEL